MPKSCLSFCCRLVLIVGSACSFAAAASVTLPLNYVPNSGASGYTITGSVTYDDALQVPNASVDGLDGLIGVNLTVHGPLISGGATTFTLADMQEWYFDTNAQARIVDLNFFSNTNGSNCRVSGVEPFLLGIYCGDDEDLEPLSVLQLQLYAPQQIPAMQPSALAGLSAVLMLLALASLAAVRKSRSRSRRA